MLWAIGYTKPMSPNQIMKHDERGVQSVRLLSMQSEQQAEQILRQPGLFTLELGADKVDRFRE